MLKNNPQLKIKARGFRASLTDAEQRLWQRLRKKQILGVQVLLQSEIVVEEFFKWFRREFLLGAPL